ncbi:MAG: choice-of-anchor Q domain-containing protein, partial [Microcoleaceae cyanobacterium]
MATITVNNTNDSGPGSLRSAIAQAQAGDIIQFNTTLANQSNPTIRLTSGQLNINKSITIDGLIPGTVPTSITISGEDKFRVLEIQVNAQSQPTNTTLKNLNIINGNAQGVAQEGAGGGVRVATFNTLTLENSQINNNKAQYGGGLFAGYQTNTTIINSKFDNNDGTLGSSERGGGAISTDSLTDLKIIDSEFTNNQGINGGAIYSVICDLNVQNSKFINNTSVPGANIDLGPNISNGYGGAIFADGAKSEGTVRTIQINNSLFDGNTAAGQAGGLYLYGYAPDKMIVENSTIINNRVIFNNKGDSYGGGIRPGRNGQFTLKNTTIANNQALSQGGGLWVGETVPMTIINSTISGNRAESEDGKEGFGGGIALANGTTPTNIINTTIANNYAGFLGGGLSAGGTNVTLTNTLLSKNIAFNGGNTWNTNHHTMTQFTDGGGNIQTTELNPNDVKATANIQLVADVLLGDLRTINGVLIHPLLLGSPAIDAGSNINAPTQDQVGQVRPVDGDGNGSVLVDIGAYEFTIQSPTPTPEPTPNTGIVRRGTINNDSLLGAAGNDTLNGLAGNDTLKGLAGNDSMAGGIGNDGYYVGETGDRVVEIVAAGNDRVFSTISYSLPANVERLVLQGTSNTNGTGNSL